jgi:hypothetical protein
VGRFSEFSKTLIGHARGEEGPSEGLMRSDLTENVTEPCQRECCCSIPDSSLRGSSRPSAKPPSTIARSARSDAASVTSRLSRSPGKFNEAHVQARLGERGDPVVDAVRALEERSSCSVILALEMDHGGNYLQELQERAAHQLLEFRGIYQGSTSMELDPR